MHQQLRLPFIVIDLAIDLTWRSPKVRPWTVLRAWAARHRQRRQLLALDARLLNDIGLSRADAVREGEKPFWKE